ncbi:MAG TPA: hypothetical protein VFP48_01385 [Steroidobacteraceae bacterium]|nr:hypothetical protein [Steroidobacteraceae bacterium]
MKCAGRTWRALLLLVYWAPALLHADTLEAIRLQHRLAEEVIPVLQPLLPADAALTGTGDVLLIRADEATIRQLRATLADIDRAPRQLLITVGQSSGGATRRTGVHGSGTVAAGDVQVGVNRPPGAETGAQVVVHDRQARNDIRSVSSVRTLEGHEAYVAVGVSRPFTSTSVVSSGPGGPVYHGQHTGYRDLQTGFYATPRVSGDRVMLEISPSQQRLGSETHRHAVTTQTVTTTLSGRLGEWLELGGVAETREGTETGLVEWGRDSELTQYSAWVKVEEIR